MKVVAVCHYLFFYLLFDDEGVWTGFAVESLGIIAPARGECFAQIFYIDNFQGCYIVAHHLLYFEKLLPFFR